MPTILILVIVLAVATSLLVVSCSDDPAPGDEAQTVAGPDVVLITVSAFRPDRLSTFGGPVAMANLDRLALDARVYEDATTVCPMTRPAIVTTLTGLTPDRSGVRDDLADRLSADAATLAERFRDGGRTTAAFVATPFVSFASGLDRGFDLFDGPESLEIGPGRYFPKVRTAEEVVGHFSEWLQTVPGDDPVFAWIHLSDLYGVGSKGTLEDAVALYDEGLGSVDAALGSVLDSLAVTSRVDTEVVFLGTHGVMLGENDRRGASHFLRDETLRVPLVWKSSALEPGRDSRSVWLSDVARTLFRLAGADADWIEDGDDLHAVAGSESDRTRRAWTWAPDDEFAWPTLTAVHREGEWHVFSWPQIADLRRDGSSEDLHFAAERSATPRDREVPPSLRQALEGVGVGIGMRETPGVPPSPDERAALISEMIQVRHLAAEDRLLRVGRITGRRIAAGSENLAVLTARMFVSTSNGNVAYSKELGAKLIALYPDRAEALHWTAHEAFLSDDIDRARLFLESAIAVGPVEPELYYDQACATALSGDVDGALEALGAALDAGYRNWDWIERDVDLATVRAHPRYTELLRAFRQ